MTRSGGKFNLLINAVIAELQEKDGKTWKVEAVKHATYHTSPKALLLSSRCSFLAGCILYLKGYILGGFVNSNFFNLFECFTRETIHNCLSRTPGNKKQSHLF